MRCLPTLRGINAHPNGNGDAGHHRDHVPYKQPPLEELVRFAERQCTPWASNNELTAVPEPVPKPPPEELARVRGPVTGSALSPGKEGSPGKIYQRVERVSEALQAIALRLQDMDHQVLLLAEQREPSGEELNQDPAAPDQALTDQAGLIAAGDVPRPKYGLPIARLRICPH